MKSLVACRALARLHVLAAALLQSARFVRLALPAALLLTGCAGGFGAAPLPVVEGGLSAGLGPGFALEGRISVNYGTQNVSGKVTWLHQSARDDIALASPLGTQVARLVRDAAGVTLTDGDQGIHRAADAETLTQQRLGWRLPLTGLASWVRARAYEATPDELRRDEGGRIALLAEAGWRIEYAYADDGNSPARLPRRLIMRYLRSIEPLEIRLVIDQWNAP